MEWWKRTSEGTKASVEKAAAADQKHALVKAAAWAWYQHGSGNYGRAARESELGHRRLTGATPPSYRRPSRYNMKAATAGPAPAPVTLLDVYEVERITRELERLSLTTNDGGGAEGRRRRGTKEVAEAGRFWGRHGVAICGAKGSVVERAVLVRRRGLGKEAPAPAPVAEVVVDRKV